MKNFPKWVLSGAMLLGLTIPNALAEEGCVEGGSVEGGSVEGGCATDTSTGEGCTNHSVAGQATLDRLFGNCGSECAEGCGTDCNSDSGITIGGWMQMGYHTDRTGLANTLYTNLLGTGAFNQRPNEVQLHQGYLFAEKVADGSNGLDWGFRADVMYGTDGQDTQAFGNASAGWDNSSGFDHGNDYGWALPQAYLEVAKGNLSVKVGHFYTIAGYETVTAPDNFFYSHSLTMYISEPFTHTGALATYTVSDNLELYAGWTAGWDTGFEQFNASNFAPFFTPSDSGSNFIGGAKLKLTPKTTLTYVGMVGHFGKRTFTTTSAAFPRLPDFNRTNYAHSIVLDTKITDKLTWVLQSDLVDNGALIDTNFLSFVGLPPGPFTGKNMDIGLNNYLLYSVTDKVGVGARAEWWHSSGVSVNEITLGLNYKPTDNLVIRPEVRHDWCPAADVEVTGFAMDVIWSF